MLFPPRNFSSFQSNLMTGRLFLVHVCTKWFRRSLELRSSTFISRGLIFAGFADVL